MLDFMTIILLTVDTIDSQILVHLQRTKIYWNMICCS